MYVYKLYMTWKVPMASDRQFIWRITAIFGTNSAGALVTRGYSTHEDKLLVGTRLTSTSYSWVLDSRVQVTRGNKFARVRVPLLELKYSQVRVRVNSRVHS